jgi:hypothetical protein
MTASTPPDEVRIVAVFDHGYDLEVDAPGYIRQEITPDNPTPTWTVGEGWPQRVYLAVLDADGSIVGRSSGRSNLLLPGDTYTALVDGARCVA